MQKVDSNSSAGIDADSDVQHIDNSSASIAANPMLPAVEFREPLCLRVKYDLSAEFVSKVNSEKDCKVEKVIEIINCKMLEYWIACPKEKENKITDYAFMTWIKNPVFQKYYHGSKAFELIAENYIAERNKNESDNNDYEKEVKNLSSALKSLKAVLIMALHHDGWAEENGKAKPIHNKLGAPQWVVKSFEALHQ